MIVIGHIFTSRPLPCDIGGYTVPPPNSRVLGRKRGWLYALDPFGFEWAFSEEQPVWLPTGAWAGAMSIERERNAVMFNGSP